MSNNSISLALINKKVLEFGCSTGHVSKILKERGCAVTSIEIDEEAAKTAEAYCERVIIGDIETIDYNKQLGNEKQKRLHQTFLQAKTFTKNCLRHFLLRKKEYFFGKAFY